MKTITISLIILINLIFFNLNKSEIIRNNNNNNNNNNKQIKRYLQPQQQEQQQEQHKEEHKEEEEKEEDCEHNPHLCLPPTPHPSPQEAHPKYRKPTLRPTNKPKYSGIYQQDNQLFSNQNYGEDAEIGLLVGFTIFCLMIVGTIIVVLYRAHSVIQSAKRVRDYLITENPEQAKKILQLNNNNNNTEKDKFSLKDITFSILETNYVEDDEDEEDENENKNENNDVENQNSMKINQSKDDEIIKSQKKKRIRFNSSLKEKENPTENSLWKSLNPFKEINVGSIQLKKYYETSFGLSMMSDSIKHSNNHTTAIDISLRDESLHDSTNDSEKIQNVNPIKNSKNKNISLYRTTIENSNESELIGISPINDQQNYGYTTHGYKAKKVSSKLVLPEVDARKNSQNEEKKQNDENQTI